MYILIARSLSRLSFAIQLCLLNTHTIEKTNPALLLGVIQLMETYAILGREYAE